MKKKTIMTMMLALVAMTGLAQTKTANVTGYSPALKDGTLVLAGTGTIGNVVDTVQAGHYWKCCRYCPSWAFRLHSTRRGTHRRFSRFYRRWLSQFQFNPLTASRCDCEIDGHRLFLPFMEN